jgi:hypothetical protein
MERSPKVVRVLEEAKREGSPKEVRVEEVKREEEKRIVKVVKEVLAATIGFWPWVAMGSPKFY